MSAFKNVSMPAIRPPSIAQQRIIVVVFSVVAGAVERRQNAGGSANHPVRKFSTTPVPNVVDELDFTNAEAAWSNLQIDTQGNLKIDALTETALSGAIALMHDQPSAPDSELAMARMAFLLERQFGAAASQQIIELLPLLKHYAETQQRWWEANGSRIPPPYAELFLLQDELLGETLAKKLFSEQRRLVRTMLATQQIRNDGSQTQAEKDLALMDMQKPLKEAAPIE